MSETAMRFVFRQADGADDIARAKHIRYAIFVREQGIPEEAEYDGLDERSIHVLAEVGNKAVGTARLTPRAAGPWALARVAVMPDYRGFGVGERLVRELEGLGAAAGAREIELHPHDYLEDFYRRLGYEKGDGDFTVGNHRLIRMYKRLGQEEQ